MSCERCGVVFMAGIPCIITATGFVCERCFKKYNYKYIYEMEHQIGENPQLK